MGRMGKFTASDLTRLQNQLNKIQAGNAEAFVESCAKELAARLLKKVIKRTPVGDYSGNSYTCESNKQQHKGQKEKGKKGGTLRRGWTIGEIRKEGGIYKIDIINSTEYASYVEYGHRTANHKGWVQGHFMLTISEQEIQEIAPRILESKIKKYLVECMK
ncbi:MAG: HK97 gp10 family phage protein [Lachnospiraceae bacterium]|nr:HK97 gp10 family phage protein [Lachnospiraceae bacterium]